MFNFLRYFIYKIIPSSLYYQIATIVKKRRLDKIQKYLIDQISTKLIFNILQKRQKSEKLFIFGSGSSINELNHSNYEEINRNCSIGINKWIFHDFVTNYYMIELTADDNLNQKFKLKILFLQKNKIKNPIFLIHKGRINPKKIKTWMQGMDPKSVFLYEYIRPDTFKKNVKSQFAKTLELLSNINKKSNVLTLGVGATLERAISLTLLLGYSKIIILGIDLKNTKVFWSKKDKNFKDIESGQNVSGYHLTATKLFGRFPLQESVVILDELAREYFNSKILISTKNSLLSNKLDKYKWKKND